MLHGIGKPVRRKEDLPFITGKGRYTADINLPNQLHLAVYRAPVAHAKINSINTQAALAADGVVAVIVAEDLAVGGIKIMRTVWPLVSKDGSPMRDHDHPVLATGKMAYFGEPPQRAPITIASYTFFPLGQPSTFPAAVASGISTSLPVPTS